MLYTITMNEIITNEGDERMTIHIYNVINADNQQIKKLGLGKKCQETASDKLKAIYGNKSAFLRLEYAGIKEL